MKIQTVVDSGHLNLYFVLVNEDSVQDISFTGGLGGSYMYPLHLVHLFQQEKDLHDCLETT